MFFLCLYFSTCRLLCPSFFFFTDTSTPEIYTLSLHDALPICCAELQGRETRFERTRAVYRVERHDCVGDVRDVQPGKLRERSEEHTSELQSPDHLVCRLLLEKKKKKNTTLTCINTDLHLLHDQ